MAGQQKKGMLAQALGQCPLTAALRSADDDGQPASITLCAALMPQLAVFAQAYQYAKAKAAEEETAANAADDDAEREEDEAIVAAVPETVEEVKEAAEEPAVAADDREASEDAGVDEVVALEAKERQLADEAAVLAAAAAEEEKEQHQTAAAAAATDADEFTEAAALPIDVVAQHPAKDDNDDDEVEPASRPDAPTPSSLDASRAAAHTPIFENRREDGQAPVAEGSAAVTSNAEDEESEDAAEKNEDVLGAEAQVQQQVKQQQQKSAPAFIAEERDFNPSDETSTDPEAYLHLRIRRGSFIGNGRYQVIKRLGEGQSSRVWLARAAKPVGVSVAVGDLVAVKVCKRGGLYADAVAYERRTIEYLSRGDSDDADGGEYSLNNTARPSSSSAGGGNAMGGNNNSSSNGTGKIAALLDAFDEETNIPMLYEDGSEIPLDDDEYTDPVATAHPCLVFARLGAPLDSIISLTNCNGINPRAVRELVRNILKINVRLAERRIIHTDLKPENLLLANHAALADDAVVAALQPTARFLPSAASTPSHTALPTAGDATTPRTGDATAAADGTALFALTPRSGLDNINSKTSASEEREGSASRMSLSIACGGDGPLVPCLADGSNALDLVLIDFGLSYFEPGEHRPITAASKKNSNFGDDDEDDADQSPNSDDTDDANLTDEQHALKEECNYQLGVEIQTREYRAPEIILGKPFNTRTDLWSVACIAYELATGRYLFDPKLTIDDAVADEDIPEDYEEPEVVRRREDEEHLRLITFTVGAKPKVASAEDAGVFEDTFYDLRSSKQRPRFDPTVTRTAPNSLVVLPETNPASSSRPSTPTSSSRKSASSPQQPLRDLDAEVRPFMGPLESPLFVSFLMKCLKWNPSERPGAEELLQHPWLTRN